MGEKVITSNYLHISHDLTLQLKSNNVFVSNGGYIYIYVSWRVKF